MSSLFNLNALECQCSLVDMHLFLKARVELVSSSDCDKTTTVAGPSLGMSFEKILERMEAPVKGIG